MNTVRSTGNVGDGLKALLQGIRGGRRLSRGAAWGMIILFALLAFEIFNYSTTQFALRDVLGDLTFAGLRWATILAIAFCGIDFAGIARIFTPQQGRDEPAEVWYLFAAWLLAAGFNATLTWWGVSVAIVNHSSAAAGAVVSSHTLTKLVPIFVAVMVLLIRVLIIGTFSVAGDNLFSMAEANRPAQRPYVSQAPRPMINPMPGLRSASTLPRPASTYRPAPKPNSPAPYEKAEPTYHNVPLDASANDDRDSRHLMQ
ncbi:MAG TPA: hypothetical protein VF784_06000 [Anaerolineales bacterium]